MKLKQIVFFAGMMSLVSLAFADLPRVRDELLTTTDHTCGIHYLTHDNTTGWYLTEVEGSCPNGVLEGAGIVTVRNAFSKPVGQLSGFFTQGYWTGHQAITAPLKSLLLRSNEDQTLVVDLGSEERLDIRYLAKLTATRRKDNTYGPFVGCRPAQILAITPELSLFEDESVQNELINSAINRMKTVCPDADQIYFYASEKENPDNKEIAFFADINLESRKVRVRRLPSSSRFRNILASPTETVSIPHPREVRRETGLPVLQVNPIKSDENKPKLQANESRVQTIPTPPSSPVTQQPPVAKGEQKLSFVPSDHLDDIPALLTASRLLKQPIDGKAMIHISGFDEKGQAVIDAPVSLFAKGPSLSLGWGIAEGQFSHIAKLDSGTTGFIQINSFTPRSSAEDR